MKFLIFLLIAIFAGLGIFYYQKTEICRNPLEYDVGSFDSRFGISKEKFTLIVAEAEAVWEGGIGRNLFDYRPNADFRVNLVFDERQRGIQEADYSKENIETSKAGYDSLISKYDLLASAYERDSLEYKEAAASFQSRLDAYNDYIASINSGGGAASQEYKRLDQEKKILESEKSALDGQAASLNRKAAELNSLGDQIKDLAEILNISVDIHNRRYGGAREFDQGEYFGGGINIYQFDAPSDLRLVLAHELGHALGLDHVENPESIMYYLMERQNLASPRLSAEDRSAFQKFCSN